MIVNLVNIEYCFDWSAIIRECVDNSFLWTVTWNFKFGRWQMSMNICTKCGKHAAFHTKRSLKCVLFLILTLPLPFLRKSMNVVQGNLRMDQRTRTYRIIIYFFFFFSTSSQLQSNKNVSRSQFHELLFTTQSQYNYKSIKRYSVAKIVEQNSVGGDEKSQVFTSQFADYA